MFGLVKVIYFTKFFAQEQGAGIGGGGSGSRAGGSRAGDPRGGDAGGRVVMKRGRGREEVERKPPMNADERGLEERQGWRGWGCSIREVPGGQKARREVVEEPSRSGEAPVGIRWATGGEGQRWHRG